MQLICGVELHSDIFEEFVCGRAACKLRRKFIQKDVVDRLAAAMPICNKNMRKFV